MFQDPNTWLALLAQYCLLYGAKEGSPGKVEVSAMLCCHSQKVSDDGWHAYRGEESLAEQVPNSACSYLPQGSGCCQWSSNGVKAGTHSTGCKSALTTHASTLIQLTAPFGCLWLS